MSSWKRAVRACLPPVLLSAFRSLRAHTHLEGRFETWEDAVARSSGYDKAEILERTVMAMREVKSGHAAFARDGIAFREQDQPVSILYALCRQAAIDGGSLRVLDFGGSLGNLFYQCRGPLLRIPNLTWQVVERPDHVEIGKAEFEQPGLTFHRSVSELEGTPPNVVLLGSVLQYLERPRELLEELVRKRPGTVIIDRTPFSPLGEQFITVQRVPEEIYPASYPSWVFSERELLTPMESEYEVHLRIPPKEELDRAVEYRGLVLVKRS